MIEWISQPWPWAVSGFMIAMVMVILLWLGGEFGVSSNLRTLCSIGGGKKFSSFFDFDWKAQRWNLVFILGAVIGGFIAHQYLNTHESIQLAESTRQNLESYEINPNQELMPEEIFSWEAFWESPRSSFLLIVGGLLIGFGSRYAGGCTSGHAISGLSQLQLPSLIAVMGFFIGGLIATWALLPIILKWI